MISHSVRDIWPSPFDPHRLTLTSRIFDRNPTQAREHNVDAQADGSPVVDQYVDLLNKDRNSFFCFLKE
jgi:hypothetical protein